MTSHPIQVTVDLAAGPATIGIPAVDLRGLGDHLAPEVTADAIPKLAAGFVTEYLRSWMASTEAEIKKVLPPPSPLRKEVMHNEAGRIREVLEYPADPPRSQTARSVALAVAERMAPELRRVVEAELRATLARRAAA